MWFFLLIATVPAFAVSWTATWIIRRRAAGWGLVDYPAERKVHRQPTPLGGGLAIWLGVMLPLISVQVGARAVVQGWLPDDWVPVEIRIHIEGVAYRGGQLAAILVAGTLLSLMGLLDDLRGLPWWPRLLLQAVVAVGVVAAGVRATVFVPWPVLSWLVSIAWILVLTNAFNFLDNMDGLSAGIAGIASLLFAAVMLTSTSEPHWLVAGVLLVLAGALGGFLCFNRHPASIFMGDSGSYLIGFLLATMTIVGTFYEREFTGRHVMLAPLCALAVPLYDFCSVMVIRLREGRSPFHADKSHFSHRLVEMGFRPTHAVLLIYLATLTTGLGSLLLYEISDWMSAGLIVALIACVLAIIAILETVGRNRQIDRHE